MHLFTVALFNIKNGLDINVFSLDKQNNKDYTYEGVKLCEVVIKNSKTYYLIKIMKI